MEQIHILQKLILFMYIGRLLVLFTYVKMSLYILSYLFLLNVQDILLRLIRYKFYLFTCNKYISKFIYVSQLIIL